MLFYLLDFVVQGNDKPKDAGDCFFDHRKILTENEVNIKEDKVKR